ncbi:hypothetical protein N9N41_06375 [Opitutales bacterium]|nr:hypothetical protein [Opitutales bacterium]
MNTIFTNFLIKITGDAVSPNLSDGTFNKDVGCINNNKIKEE